MKRKSRLQFTEEERADPFLEKAIHKSEKMADKLDKAHAKIPKQKIKVKQRTFDEATGKTKVRLHFEEVDKVKPPSKLTHIANQSPTIALQSNVHSKMSEYENDNVSVEAAHKAEQAGEFSARQVQNSYHSQKLKPYREHAKAERKSANADVDYLYKKKMQDNPNATTNSISKWQQKRAIKKEYLASQGGKKTAQQTASATTSAVKKGGEKVVQAVGAVLKDPKVLLIILAILLVAGVLGAMVSSVSLVFQGAISNTVATSYTSDDAELIATNDNYTALESNLQLQINNIETDYPDYDEYRYDLDSIAHDPHQLASYLTAVFQTFSASQVQGEIEDIFDSQYALTLIEEIEVRYRTETRTGTTTTIDDYGNIIVETYEYEVEVPYDYYILNVTLDNIGIDSVANSSLSSSELEMYNVYLETSGNKPLLFGGGSSDGTPSTDLSGVVFVDGVRTGNQDIVDIALAQVGNVGGQPYWSWYGFSSRVEWCACFVSWSLNQAGYSEPKFAACQSQGVPYFSSNGRWADSSYEDIAPGDVIFFDWNGDGSANHVGIVIGTDGSRVYTVEGNSGDACKIKDYDLNSDLIMGYGLMN